MRTNAMKTILAVAMIAMIAPVAEAGLTPITSRSAFMARLEPAKTGIEDFNLIFPPIELPTGGGSADRVVPTGSFGDVVVTFEADANSGGIMLGKLGSSSLSTRTFVGKVNGPDVPPSPSDPSSSPTNQYNRIVFSRPINAFAADFGQVNEGGLEIWVMGEKIDVPNFTGFLGFGTPANTTEIEIRATGSVQETFTIDNLTFQIAVPEPATAGLGLLGLAALGTRIRRRK